MFAAQNLTVLHIEQDSEIRSRVTKLMRENGLRVFETDSTSVGCDLFRMNEIDIILIDLEIPKNDGIDFIHCLREKEILTPVIITTNHTDSETLLEAINLDITRYLIKPYKQCDLMDALQIAIKKAINCHPLVFTHFENGFSYDPINKTINHPNGTLAHLSKKEYLMMELLLKNRHNIVTYDAIEMLVWEGSVMSMDALRTLVRGIRKKAYSDIISNQNGIGYKIDMETFKTPF